MAPVIIRLAVSSYSNGDKVCKWATDIKTHRESEGGGESTLFFYWAYMQMRMQCCESGKQPRLLTFDKQKGTVTVHRGQYVLYRCILQEPVRHHEHTPTFPLLTPHQVEVWISLSCVCQEKKRPTALRKCFHISSDRNLCCSEPGERNKGLRYRGKEKWGC